MAAIEPELDKEAILIAHEKTYHAFSVLLPVVTGLVRRASAAHLRLGDAE